MLDRRSGSVLCWCLALAALGSATASGQLFQGSDYSGVLFTDPENWTSRFATGFDPELMSPFEGPASEDHDAGTICVEF